MLVTHLHVGFRVEDYEQWQAGYDASLDARKASGELAYQVYRNVDDPNVVTVLSVQRSAEEIQAFMDSPDMEERMKAAGITQMGEQYILEAMDSGEH